MNWFDILSPVISLASAVIGYLLSRYLWNRINVLALNGDVDILPKEVSLYGTSTFFFRLGVQNKSKFKVARGVKPALRLKGQKTFGNTHYEITISGGLCWAELGNPSKVDINCGEETVFDLCRIVKEGNVIYGDDYFTKRYASEFPGTRYAKLHVTRICFPSERGYEVPRPILIKEVRENSIRYRTELAIDVPLFIELDWSGEIILTAENNPARVARLNIDALKCVLRAITRPTRA